MNKDSETSNFKNNSHSTSTSRNCYCNSSRCFINKGIEVKEQDIHNKILHKYRCCKPCKNKFGYLDSESNTPCVENILDDKIEDIITQKDIENNFNNKIDDKYIDCFEIEIDQDIEMKNKSEKNNKNNKGTKQNTSESKKKMGQELSKKNNISNEPWNSSTKVFKNEVKNKKEQIENKEIETKIQKKKLIKKTKIDNKTKGNEKENNINKYNKKEAEKIKENEEKYTKGEKSNIKRSDSNVSDSTYQEEYNDDKETIYISYSLKGYIKIKSRKDIEICDKYYLEGNEMCKGCECGCKEERNEDEIKESVYEYCECCDTVRTDYYSSNCSEESLCCDERCLCLG